MPLIKSPRQSPEDLKAWEEHSRYDKRLWALTEKKTARAVEAIKEFTRYDSTGYISCSWGKDSTVVAHLCVVEKCTLPIVWVRVKGWENPDCVLVRDAFLADYEDQVDYHEITVDPAAPRRWENASQGTQRTSTLGFKEAARRFGHRHISGVRGAESAQRSMAMAVHGIESAHSCRPIGYWKNQDVFSYLAHHDLPIHPAYAMNLGGAKPRDHIRVGSLGGSRGTELGRGRWEEHYYPDVVRK